MRFEKWHGIGNAYLVMEQDDLPMEAGAERVRRICHPDLGAGGDGILLIGGDDGGRPRVRIFNPDGGEAEFSGNGTRIAAGYLMERDGVDAVEMLTIKGIIRGERRRRDHDRRRPRRLSHPTTFPARRPRRQLHLRLGREPALRDRGG
jgi:diaminopimelate epimerase